MTWSAAIQEVLDSVERGWITDRDARLLLDEIEMQMEHERLLKERREKVREIKAASGPTTVSVNPYRRSLRLAQKNEFYRSRDREVERVAEQFKARHTAASISAPGGDLIPQSQYRESKNADQLALELKWRTEYIASRLRGAPLTIVEGNTVDVPTYTCGLCASVSLEPECGNSTCLGLTDQEWAMRDAIAWWCALEPDPTDLLPVDELDRRIGLALTKPPVHTRLRTVLRDGP